MVWGMTMDDVKRWGYEFTREKEKGCELLAVDILEDALIE